jgi:hypothetical protein
MRTGVLVDSPLKVKRFKGIVLFWGFQSETPCQKLFEHECQQASARRGPLHAARQWVTTGEELRPPFGPLVAQCARYQGGIGHGGQ